MRPLRKVENYTDLLNFSNLVNLNSLIIKRIKFIKSLRFSKLGFSEWPQYSIIHPKDIGEVVAEILTDENIQQHIGKRYDLSGSKIYNGGEVADEIGILLNQKIDYVPIPVDMWIDAMKNLPYVNDFLTSHLREFSRDIAIGKFDKTTEVVKKITGHDPRTFKEYIRENLDAFKTSDLNDAG